MHAKTSGFTVHDWLFICFDTKVWNVPFTDFFLYRYVVFMRLIVFSAAVVSFISVLLLASRGYRFLWVGLLCSGSEGNWNWPTLDGTSVALVVGDVPSTSVSWLPTMCWTSRSWLSAGPPDKLSLLAGADVVGVGVSRGVDDRRHRVNFVSVGRGDNSFDTESNVSPTLPVVTRHYIISSCYQQFEKTCEAKQKT